MQNNHTQSNYLPHQNLRVWREAVEMVRAVHLQRICNAELRDQATRAAISVALKLAEGANRDRKAALNHFRAVRVSATEAGGQDLHGGGKEENEHCVRKALLELRTALDVNVKQDIDPTVQQFAGFFSAGPVFAAEHVGPFHKGVARHHGIKRGVIHKVVVHAVTLLSARRARGVADGQREARVQAQKAVAEGCFSSAAGGGKNDGKTGVLRHVWSMDGGDGGCNREHLSG